MTRTTRRILFYCAIFIFFGASYIVLLYAQGYKYDFSQQRFIRSGAIYLKANTTARVLVDGKEVATTSLLGNSASISGVLPATHTLSIQKEGHSIWQKKVTVVAGFVEDYTRIMLLPQIGEDRESVKKEIRLLLYPPTPTPTPAQSPSAGKSPVPTAKKTPTPSPIPSPSPDRSGPYYIEQGSLFVNTEEGPLRIASGITSAALSDDRKKLAWFSEGAIWVYWLSDTDYQPLRHAGDLALIAKFNTPIKAAQWFRDSDHIALDAGGLKVIEIDTRPNLNIINF